LAVEGRLAIGEFDCEAKRLTEKIAGCWQVGNEQLRRGAEQKRLRRLFEIVFGHGFESYPERLPGDLTVMGDFNNAPWSRVQRAFRAKTGIDNIASWQPSWPSLAAAPAHRPCAGARSSGVDGVRDRAEDRRRSFSRHRRNRLARVRPPP
jgi:hypothetical protein